MILSEFYEYISNGDVFMVSIAKSHPRIVFESMWCACLIVDFSSHQLGLRMVQYILLIGAVLNMAAQGHTCSGERTPYTVPNLPFHRESRERRKNGTHFKMDSKANNRN